MTSENEPWEHAAQAILASLVESDSIELVTSRGLSYLTTPLANLLQQLSPEQGSRAEQVADWLMEQQEVADLYADDEQLESVLAEALDQDAGESAPAISRPEDAPRNAALEQALVEDSDSDALYLIYGDWLQERGDPRGELVMRQAALLLEPDPEQDAAARAFLDRNRQAILGRLADYQDVVRLHWHCGFVRSAHLWNQEERYEQYQGAILLRWLLDLPAAALLRELWLGPFDGQGSDQYAEMLGVLLEQPRPALEQLRAGVADYPVDTHASHLGFLPVELSRQLPGLRELTLRGGQLSLAPLSLPQLEQLQLSVAYLGPESVEALAQSELPQLEQLQLETNELVGQQVEALGRLLQGKGVPLLSELSLRMRQGLDAALTALASSPLLSQLTELDLSDSWLTDEQVQVVLDHAEAFSQLEQLVLDGNQLSPQMVQRLCALGEWVCADEQLDPEPEWDGAQQEDGAPDDWDEDEAYDDIRE